MTLGKELPLPSAAVGHSAKLTAAYGVSWCRWFAEWRALPSVEHYAKASLLSAFLCRVSDTKQKGYLPECLTLPSVQHSTKSLFAKCLSLLSAALGKLSLCRVPVILRSANIFVLGKERVSGSDIGLLNRRCTWWCSRTRVGVKFDCRARHCLGRQHAALFLELGIYIKHILASVSIDTYSCSKPQTTQQQASERDKTE